MLLSRFTVQRKLKKKKAFKIIKWQAIVTTQVVGLAT